MFEENEISIKANGGTEIAKRSLSTLIDPELQKHFQVISSRAREIDESKIRIFFAHDLPEDPESAKFKDQEFKDSFHKMVFISNWQYQRYQLFHNIGYDDKSIVLETGIVPAPSSTLVKPDDGKIRIVYTSTPQRGLELLIPAFEFLAEKHQEIHLDVFSSFKIYGWDEADAQFEPLYDQIRNHPRMTYHGFVPNDTLKEHLTQSDIFAYPCIWTETSCRAMLEAMSAGLVCVHPNYGALPETSGSLNVMYQGDADRVKHMNAFALHLSAAINVVKNKQHTNMITFNKIFVDSRYNIEFIANKWNSMLKELLEKYPTVESRKKPSPKFIYRT